MSHWRSGATSRRRRRDQRGRALTWLLAVLTVLLVLVVVADRVGDHVAEETVAERLQTSQDLPTRPDVDIAGFPFLTQLAARHYGHVVVRSSRVPVGSSDLTLVAVRLDFRDVDVSRDYRSFRAARGTATARIGYADLSRALTTTVRYAGDGRISATGRFTLLGRSISPTISVRPSAEDGTKLAFTDPRLSGVGDLGNALSEQVAGTFFTDLPLDDLPYDVTVRSVRADAAGVELGLRGQDLSFSQG